MAEEITPRVFVSYSWSSEEHVSWVVSLAQKLVSDGVDVVLDKWDLKEGHDKHSFMERMVADPTIAKVLAVCDRKYAEKADGRLGGVGTETQIISPEVYAKTRQEKFIPLVREWNDDATPAHPCLPVFFKNAIYIDFSDDEAFNQAYERLIRNIYGAPELKKPSLGKKPAHLSVEYSALVIPAGKLDRLKDAIQRGKPNTQIMLRDYLDSFADSFEGFRIVEPNSRDKPLDDKVCESIQAFLPYRDNFIEFVLFFGDYMNTVESYEKLLAFLESILAYQYRPETMQSWSEDWFDNYRFIHYEMFLSLVAALFKNKHYELAAKFIEAEYFVPRGPGASDHYETGASGFNQHARSLDEVRNNRLQMNLTSVTAKLLLDRATHPKVSRRDIHQADVLLFLRQFFPEPGACSYWYPRCANFVWGETLELFAKAPSQSGLKALKTLLKVKDIRHLHTCFEEAFNAETFRRFYQNWTMMRIDWQRLFNLEGIARAANAR